MEKLSVWFCGLYTTPCLTGLLYGYDTVSISGAIDFLQDKYGRRRSTGRRAKSSTRPRFAASIGELIIWVVCVQTTLLRSVGF